MVGGRIPMDPLAPFADNRAGGKKYETPPDLQTEVPIPIQYHSILHETSSKRIVLGT